MNPEGSVLRHMPEINLGPDHPLPKSLGTSPESHLQAAITYEDIIDTLLRTSF